jgi:hypothetical protein
LDILREVVELVQHGHASIGAIDVMTHRYGYRWASHPDWQTHNQQIDFYLESLCDTGELRKVNYAYVPSGQRNQDVGGCRRARQKAPRKLQDSTSLGDSYSDIVSARPTQVDF